MTAYKFGDFLAALGKGVPHVVLLAGEEPYYIKKAEEALIKRLFPKESERLTAVQPTGRDPSPRELAGILETLPFLSEKSLYIVRDTSLFREKKAAAEDDEKKKAKKDKALERLIEVLGDMPETNYVIFESGAKADKRKKLYKAVEKAGAILDAEPERPWTAEPWIRGKLAEMGRSFDREATAYFTRAISDMKTVPLSFLDTELEKLALYTKNPRFSRGDLERVFSSAPEVSGFALYDAVTERDAKRALSILEREIAEGTYLPLILAGLSNEVRRLWHAKRLIAKGIRGKALAKPLEVHPFVADKLSRAAASFDESLLREVFLGLSDADYLIKTGQGGPELLEYAVIRLCRGSLKAR